MSVGWGLPFYQQKDSVYRLKALTYQQVKSYNVWICAREMHPQSIYRCHVSFSDTPSSPLSPSSNICHTNATKSVWIIAKLAMVKLWPLG